MEIAVYVFAFRVIFCAVIVVHLIITVQNSKFHGASHVVLPSALGVITAKKSMTFPAVCAATLVRAFSSLLELSSDNFLLIVDEPNVDEPIDATDVGPN